ncbi:hypothetical protein ES703_49708 [subsurface metagenome]
MSDVNKVPKKEAIAYLKKNRSRESEKELAGILISLIEKDLVDAVYKNGDVAYQAKGDHFTAFVKIWSTESEQAIKNMLPKMMKIIKKYKEEVKAPYKMGELSEPLIESLLKKVSNLDFSVLSEREARDEKTKIIEVIMDVKSSLEEEERKLLEHEREVARVIELFEKFQNRSVSEVKRILSETRKQLEEKKTKERSSSQPT